MIWVDLDNTLIYCPGGLDRLAARIVGAYADRLTRRLENATEGDSAITACVRPCAPEFLSALRQLTDVRLLTTATRAHAGAMNNRFDLGFASDTIVAREDWMEFPPPFSRLYRPRTLDVDPAGVLIDDDDASIHCRMKLAYLGTRSLVTIPSYRGSNPDPFTQEWSGVVSRVRGTIAQAGRD